MIVVEAATSADPAARTDEIIHRHPVVAANSYTAWFVTGAASGDETRHLTVPFSVFSHLFAQLRKVINAADLDTYRSGRVGCDIPPSGNDGGPGTAMTTSIPSRWPRWFGRRQPVPLRGSTFRVVGAMRRAARPGL